MNLNIALPLLFAVATFGTVFGENAWQSMSPFTKTMLDSDWGSNWAIQGDNWRHHVRQKMLPGASFDNIDNLPVVVTHSFSTCPDSQPPKRNGLSSSGFHLPEGSTLPAMVTAELSFIVGQTCLDANRPHCASLELWMLEGVGPTTQQLLRNDTTGLSGEYPKSRFLTDSAVMPGLSLSERNRAVKRRAGNDSNIRKSTISFPIKRPPFKLQFRDRRGACVEVINVELLITSCFVGTEQRQPGVRGEEDNSTEVASETVYNASTTAAPGGMTTPRTSDMLTDLRCKCPAGYRKASFDRCEACPPNTFAFEPHTSQFCNRCPYRSAAPFAGSKLCVCEEGAFRAQGEDASLACTIPPSAPRQVIAAYLDVHTVIVNWTEPENFGGRKDITYQVQCVAGCDDVTINRRDSKVRVAEIKSLQSLETSFVSIRIYSLNGVSAIAGPNYARYFEAVITLRSSAADAAYAHIPDRVFILVGIFGGLLLIAGFFAFYALWRHYRRRRRRGEPIIVIGSSLSEDGADSTKAKLTDVASEDSHPQSRTVDDFGHSQQFGSSPSTQPLIDTRESFAAERRAPIVQPDSAMSPDVSPAKH